MNWWQWTLIGVGSAIGAVMVGGRLIAREHSATCSARFGAVPSVLYGSIKDVASAPSWRKEVSAVELLPPQDGKPAWCENSSWGKVTYLLEVDEPDRRIVIRIADRSLPYGGTWTFRLEPDGAGTRLSITEDGFVDPALFRLLARFVFGYHRTIRDYLEALAKKLGESVTIEHS